jgi:hypothetical protein
MARQCARRTIAEAKQRSQWSVMGWVTKNYLELRASEGTLSWPGCICSRTPTNQLPAWWVMARSPCG